MQPSENLTDSRGAQNAEQAERVQGNHRVHRRRGLTLGLGLGLAAETSVTADGSTPHTVTVADNQGPTVVTP